MPKKAAPPVLYSLKRSPTLGCLLLSCQLLALLVLSVWSWRGNAGSSVWLTGAAWLIWVLALIGAMDFWLRQRKGQLRWDGQGWAIRGVSPGDEVVLQTSSPEVLLDLQSALWLRVSSSGRKVDWLWLEKSTQPERWLDLRRAVYSRPRPGSDNADPIAPVRSGGA